MGMGIAMESDWERKPGIRIKLGIGIRIRMAMWVNWKRYANTDGIEMEMRMGIGLGYK